MKTVCDINRCNGCMACIEKCQNKCISIKDNIYTYNAVIDEHLCVNCFLCEKVCPRNTKTKKQKPFQWYQGWADDQIRKNSSSGGAAACIINSFIKTGGYVASCLFKEGQFLFEITNDLEKAKHFAGSKYVKSNPIGIYKVVEEKLKTNSVLFVGLPCQIAGLKNYLKNDDNLFTVDLICHGTPSPQLLEMFLEEHSIDISKVTDLKFRDSTSMGLAIDGMKICSEGVDDYLLTFLDAIDYTENCYYCEYATFERVGDITLGDSWGTEYREEEKNGISLVLVNSRKGQELLKDTGLKLMDVDIENAVAENHQLQQPSILKPERAKFMNRIITRKSFSSSTFMLYKKKVLKRNIKKALTKLHVWGD